MMAGMAVVGDFAGGAGGMRPGMNMGMGAGMGNKSLGRAMIGGGGVNPNIPRGPRDGPGPLGMGGPGPWSTNGTSVDGKEDNPISILIPGNFCL